MSPGNGKKPPKLAAAKEAKPPPAGAGDDRTRWQRLCQRLGFGTVLPPHWRRDPKYASDYLVTSVKVEFTWRERFMLLVSGRLHIAISTKTHPQVKRSVSKTAVGVLVPGER